MSKQVQVNCGFNPTEGPEAKPRFKEVDCSGPTAVDPLTPKADEPKPETASKKK
jgi:hypothetical protein